MNFALALQFTDDMGWFIDKPRRWMFGSWHRGVGWRQGTKRGIEISPVDGRVVNAPPCMGDFEAEYCNVLPPGEIGIAGAQRRKAHLEAAVENWFGWLPTESSLEPIEQFVDFLIPLSILPDGHGRLESRTGQTSSIWVPAADWQCT